MAKVVLTARERQKRRIHGTIMGKAKERGVTLTDIGQIWDVTPQGASFRITSGKISLLDFFELQKLLNFSEEELKLLMAGGDS